MNGKVGDDPISDICDHHVAVFSPKADALVREIHLYLPRYRMWELFDWGHPPAIAEFERQLEARRDELKRDALARGWEPPARAMSPLTPEYGPASPPRAPGILFWSLHIATAIIGVFAIEPAVHTAMRGRPGDAVVAMFTLLSMVCVVVAMIPVFLAWLRTRRPSLSLTVGATAGLLCWVPGYVAMFLLF